MNLLPKIIFTFTVLFFTMPCHGIQACTLWAAAGDRVLGGGTLIAKNRDWNSVYPQTLKLVSPEKGFRYYGLFEYGNEVSGIKMGVNDKASWSGAIKVLKHGYEPCPPLSFITRKRDQPDFLFVLQTRRDPSKNPGCFSMKSLIAIEPKDLP